ncbi:MAG: response regulator [Candidatus Omnitrophica bacterium]|nr:response regulator [Candidatus Omnitrophota bacterium]MDD5355354.1 response regulator [Candidatus Omnitrophota bacterium]
MWKNAEDKKAKKKILIVDDEEDFTKLVKLNLEKTAKYEVKTENIGLRGLAAAKAFKPDLVLLDIFMPDLGGNEIATQLKNDRDTADIPVVFLTAVVRKEEVEGQSGIIGGYHFIAKPVDTEEIIEVIERIVT